MEIMMQYAASRLSHNLRFTLGVACHREPLSGYSALLHIHLQVEMHSVILHSLACI